MRNPKAIGLLVQSSIVFVNRGLRRGFEPTLVLRGDWLRSVGLSPGAHLLLYSSSTPGGGDTGHECQGYLCYMIRTPHQMKFLNEREKFARNNGSIKVGTSWSGRKRVPMVRIPAGQLMKGGLTAITTKVVCVFTRGRTARGWPNCKADYLEITALENRVHPNDGGRLI